MEGPFLSQLYCGANELKSICKPSILVLNERINGFENDISLMKLAPEIKGSFEVISRLKELNIVVSLGNLSADFKSAMKAFNNCVRMVTHTFTQ